MSEQKTIAALYEQDHDRLDELFKTFQQLKRSDFAKAKEAFAAFKIGLQRHISVGRRNSISIVGEGNRHHRRWGDFSHAHRVSSDWTAPQSDS